MNLKYFTTSMFVSMILFPSQAGELSVREQESIFQENRPLLTIKNGITIGVIDSGFDLEDWPGFSNFFAKDNVGRTFFYDYVEGKKEISDEMGHGTHVTSILINELNGMGHNQKYQILPMRVCGQTLDECDAIALLFSLLSTQKYELKLVNISINFLGKDKAWDSFKAILEIFHQRGTILVVSAGNEGVNFDENEIYRRFLGDDGKVIYDNIVFVGSGDLVGSTKSNFSNYGKSVNFYSAGDMVFSNHLSGKKAILSGTSQAAPVVTAHIASEMINHPEEDYRKIIQRVFDSGRLLNENFGIESEHARFIWPVFHEMIK